MKKKLLFIYYSYHEYSNKIIKSLETLGFEIDCFSFTPKLNNIEKIINYLTKDKYFIKKVIHNQKHYFSSLKFFNYDYVFVLNGGSFNSDAIDYLRRKLYNAKFILYLWDDIARVGIMNKKINLFDKIYSFDSSDCKKYNFEFLPLFYTNDFKKENVEKKFDLFFCGIAHSKRKELLEYAIDFSRKNNMTLKSALYIGRLLYFKNYLLNSDFRNDLKKHYIYNQINLNEVADYTCTSRCTIDMPIKSQTGLAMRCIEALAAQTKIITTNEHIKEYDFYCPENVMIIDRENPAFDIDFIKSPYKPIPKEIVEKYSLENWVKTIFKE